MKSHSISGNSVLLQFSIVMRNDSDNPSLKKLDWNGIIKKVSILEVAK
jgi:hypothetical protein